MTISRLHEPQVEPKRLGIHKYQAWEGAVLTHGFALFDKRDDTILWRGHGFSYPTSRDDAIDVARRAVLGLRPKLNAAASNGPQAKAWATRHWGPER